VKPESWPGDYIDESFETSRNMREWTENDVGQVHSLTLNRPHVLNGLCKVMGMSLTTEWYSSDRTSDRWTVTPADAPSFTGTMREVGIYVLGYACGWRGQRARARGRLRTMEQTLAKMREEL
jgi:hypothetical protein